LVIATTSTDTPPANTTPQATPQYSSSSATTRDDAELSILQAEKALNDRQYQSAIDHANAALALDPEPQLAARAQLLIGRAWFHDQQFERADEAFGRTLELNPFLTEALLYLGLTRFNRDDFEGAIEAFGRLINQPADKLDQATLGHTYLMRGRSYFHLGDNERALADLERAASEVPSNHYAFHHMGVVYFARRKNFAVAREMFDKALAIDPNFVPALLFRGCCFAYLNDFNRAFDDLSAAYDRDPRWVHQFIDMGIQANQHDPKRFGVDLEEARGFMSRFTSNLQMLVMQGKVTGWQVFLYFGLYQQFKKEYEASVQSLSQALEQAPFEHKRKIHIFRGQSLDMIGRHQEAVADFSAALAIAPNDNLGLLSRGVAYLKLGQLDAARTDLLQVHELTPSEPRVVMHLGMIACLQRRWEDAQQLFQRVQELAPTDSRSYSLMAWLLCQAPEPLRNLDQAEQQALLGIEKNNEVALSWGMAGAVAEARGNLGAAKLHYQRALAKGPEHWYFNAAFYRLRLDR
jgi:tetratricopeptide (TPR) repeat protein